MQEHRRHVCNYALHAPGASRVCGDYAYTCRPKICQLIRVIWVHVVMVAVALVPLPLYLYLALTAPIVTHTLHNPAPSKLLLGVPFPWARAMLWWSPRSACQQNNLSCVH